jgi:phenylpropionate dioxygenase-like ring-hydroxylating dioxygenase large terminal subunit
MAAAPDVLRALEGGLTLPASWYGADERVYRAELDRIFARAWQYAGRAELVRERGQFFAAYAGHVPVAVVRHQDGGLRAFVNVCRHRGHLVVEGEGRRESLQCPYHAWTYDLDGRLRAAPRADREPGFDLACFSLLPVAVDTWGPFVFVNPDPGAAPLADSLGRLPELLAEGAIDLDRLRFRRRDEWTIDVNWKVAIENYLECYHCPLAHPSFSKVVDVDPDVYRLEADGLVLSQLAPARVPRPGERLPYPADGEVRRAQFHLLWPNFGMNVEPGPPNLSVDVWLPDGPRRVRGFADRFFGEDVDDETAEALAEFSAQVGREDNALVASVQRGLDSGMVPHGRVLPDSEQLLRRFQRLVYEAVATG